MEKTINITIKTDSKNPDGASMSVVYEPDDIRSIALALIGDEALRETALLASSYIIATSPDPSATVNGLIEMSKDIMKENGMTETLKFN